jgi:polysaccharide biosynthesis protein PslH
MKGPRLKRVLILSPYPPRLDANHGGAKAVAHVIEGLGARHEVGVLCFRSAADAPVDPALRQRCAFVEEIPRRTNRGPLSFRLLRAGRLLGALVRGIPTWGGAFSHPLFRRRVRELAVTWQPDVVQAEFHVMGPYLRGLTRGGLATVLVEHEPGVPVAAERLRTAPRYARPWHRLELAAWRRFEPRALRAADAVVAFTEPDRETLLRLAPGAHIETIPLAVPLASAHQETSGSTVLFVGNFAHPPNREAADRLTRVIFPEVRARCPEARLLLVGPWLDGQPPGEPSAGVEVTGWVEDVAPYLAGAQVVVAPIFSGGGMRLKVLEALAAGKAVVATPLAVAGLDVQDGDQVALASDEAAFAERIVHLLTDAPARAALAERARQWAEEHVSVDRMARAYEALYDSLLSGR